MNLAKRMFPLHARVTALFGTVEIKHHQCAMDDLYNSAAFFKVAYNHEKINESWCYKEINERHPIMLYTILIEVKECTY